MIGDGKAAGFSFDFADEIGRINLSAEDEGMVKMGMAGNLSAYAAADVVEMLPTKIFYQPLFGVFLSQDVFFEKNGCDCGRRWT